MDMPTNFSSPDQGPVVDDLLQTLCHRVRREVIRYFEESTERGDATLPELVAHLDERLPAETEERLRIKLTHTHLPKLEKRGWLDYDPDTGHIVYNGHDAAKQLLSELHALF